MIARRLKTAVIVLAGVVLGVAGALLADQARQPSFSGEVLVLVTPVNTGDGFVQEEYLRGRAQAYAGLAASESFNRAVRQDLGVDPSDGTTTVTARVGTNTALIYVSATASSPTTVRDALSSATALLQARSASLDSAELSTPALRMEPISPVVAPEQPSSPGLATLLFAGMAGGLLVGAAAAVLAVRMDERLRTLADAERIAEQPVEVLLTRTRGPGGPDAVRRRRTDVIAVLLRVLESRAHGMTIVTVTPAGSTADAGDLARELTKIARENHLRAATGVLPGSGQRPTADEVDLSGHLGALLRGGRPSEVESLPHDLELLVVSSPALTDDSEARAWAREADRVVVLTALGRTTAAELLSTLQDPAVEGKALLVAERRRAGGPVRLETLKDAHRTRREPVRDERHLADEVGAQQLDDSPSLRP